MFFYEFVQNYDESREQSVQPVSVVSSSLYPLTLHSAEFHLHPPFLNVKHLFTAPGAHQPPGLPSSPLSPTDSSLINSRSWQDLLIYFLWCLNIVVYLNIIVTLSRSYVYRGFAIVKTVLTDSDFKPLSSPVLSSCNSLPFSWRHGQSQCLSLSDQTRGSHLRTGH